jgi:hypothetical protein
MENKDFNPAEATWEELLAQWEKHTNILEVVEATVSVIKEEMSHRLEQEGLKAKAVEDRQISVVSGVRFSTSVKDAEDLGAIKLEKKVDTGKLRKLLDSGVDVPGTERFSYVRISNLKVEE